MHELIAPTINFSLLVIVLTYFLRKPVKEMVATRHSNLKKLVEEARQQKAEAERRYKEFNDKLAAFEGEARQILDRSRQDGEALKNKIVKDAYTTAERIVKEAESTVQANIQDYKDQIRRETIDKAVEMAERMIRERMSSDDQRRIVTEYVGKVQ